LDRLRRRGDVWKDLARHAQALPHKRASLKPRVPNDRTPSGIIAGDAGLNADHQLVTSGAYRIVRHPISARTFPF